MGSRGQANLPAGKQLHSSGKQIQGMAVRNETHKRTQNKLKENRNGTRKKSLDNCFVIHLLFTETTCTYNTFTTFHTLANCFLFF